MRRGRPAPDVELADSERRTLEDWTTDPGQARELAQRARIVLRCGDGLTNMEIARRLGVTRETAGKWRRRFIEARVCGLLDEPRPGAPSTIRQEDIERVRDLVAERPPTGVTWSTRTMARKAGMSQTAISRIWKIFTLEPHSALPAHFPKEGLHAENVRAVGGLYLDPPLRAFVLLQRSEQRSSSEGANGRANGHGDARGLVSEAPPSVFARLDSFARKVNGHKPGRSDMSGLIAFLESVERSLPSGCDAHLVLGGVSITRVAQVNDWLCKRAHFHVHSIPTSGSWLRLVESWAGALRSADAQGADWAQGAAASVVELERTVARYLSDEQGIGRGFSWLWSGRSARVQVQPSRAGLPRVL